MNNERPAPSLMDVTLRDGGLNNDFRFGDAFARALYELNAKMGVAYTEVGYKASPRLFAREDYGKWKFCDDGELFKVFGEGGGTKLAVMADAGRCDWKTDIRPRAQSPIALVRVACYFEQLGEALRMIDDIKNKGYEVSCNLMAVSRLSEKQIRHALKEICASYADIVCIVDSFGALLPRQAEELTQIYLEYTYPAGKRLGIHAHDNLRLALANTLTALDAGATVADAAYGGIGRGAGSCAMEALLGCLWREGLIERSKSDGGKPFSGLDAGDGGQIGLALRPVMEFLEGWGGEAFIPNTDPAFLLTGLADRHPRAAISYRRAGREDIVGFAEELRADGAQ